jgi:hypothetical protein
MQTHTNNVNKTRTLLQTTGGKDEPNTNDVCLHVCVVHKNDLKSNQENLENMRT